MSMHCVISIFLYVEYDANFRVRFSDGFRSQNGAHFIYRQLSAVSKRSRDSNLAELYPDLGRDEWLELLLDDDAFDVFDVIVGDVTGCESTVYPFGCCSFGWCSC